MFCHGLRFGCVLVRVSCTLVHLRSSLHLVNTSDRDGDARIAQLGPALAASDRRFFAREYISHDTSICFMTCGMNFVNL